MWIFSIMISWVADWMISSERFNHTQTRKIINSIGQYGPAVCLIAASYTGCDRVLTVALLTIGVGLNGGIYSGFKINHLDITPRFAGILMSLTNCTANLAGLLAPITAGILVEGKVSVQIKVFLCVYHSHFFPFNKQPTMAAWQKVFFIAAGVYIFCATFYNVFGSGKRQPWDNPANDDHPAPIPVATVNETSLNDQQLTHRKTTSNGRGSDEEETRQ